MSFRNATTSEEIGLSTTKDVKSAVSAVTNDVSKAAYSQKEDKDLTKRVYEAIKDRFEGTLRLRWLWSCYGVTRYRANWWGEEDIPHSRFMRVYYEDGELIIDDVTV